MKLLVSNKVETNYEIALLILLNGGIWRLQVSVSAILYCCPFLALISLRGIKMKHYGFRK
ncbi:hypothetical protein GAZ19_18295 [Bacteroides xylanisolvens]|uniref:Uncharacterized protein n=1 Tax=Bacteroides xylanisolvens TaxID=371601 RepID=A0A6A2RRD3_9BACE|nr:hypothetical protein GA402_13170 [Bacteroides xylanisolvens]KAB6132461.1 hypothetical protein GA424_22325 [Bacteroides xylanisolvens]KAB6158453.1 hypothetical protein GA423_10330 [Bacteroides xylanisolvens]KAB6403995.1 hypothetical protein GAZ19_18295 [Bacteroides xylanisolvens]KAB6433861.1 hypothetical protein GAZ16_17515 [Bacteroides xylanisolvens]